MEPGETGLSEPSIFGRCVPWKWIEWACGVSFVNVTLRRSSCPARRIGPGTFPLYVHASKVVFSSSWIFCSLATISISRTRPGLCSVGLGGTRRCSSSSVAAIAPPTSCECGLS